MREATTTWFGLESEAGGEDVGVVVGVEGGGGDLEA